MCHRFSAFKTKESDTYQRTNKHCEQGTPGYVPIKQNKSRFCNFVCVRCMCVSDTRVSIYTAHLMPIIIQRIHSTPQHHAAIPNTMVNL